MDPPAPKRTTTTTKSSVVADKDELRACDACSEKEPTVKLVSGQKIGAPHDTARKDFYGHMDRKEFCKLFQSNSKFRECVDNAVARSEKESTVDTEASATGGSIASAIERMGSGRIDSDDEIVMEVENSASGYSLARWRHKFKKTTPWDVGLKPLSVEDVQGNTRNLY